VLYRSWVVFSLGGCFPPSFLAIDKARYSAFRTTSFSNSLLDYHHLSSAFPGKFDRASSGSHMLRRTPHLQTLSGMDSVWADPFSLAANNGISIDFSSSWYSNVFFPMVCVPRGTPECLAAVPIDWTPFGNLRIEECLRLPGAYRSLPRPSSPSQAKAIHHTASLCRMILTSPADACANPMHGIIAGVARESAFLPHLPFASDSASDAAS
jgi:hypothetical protein